MTSISHLRRAALVLMAFVATTLGLTACDPNDPVQRQAFYELNPDVPAEELTVATMNEAQRSVVKALQDRQTAFYVGIARAEQERRFYEGVHASRSSDCYGAMRQVFPASVHGWAEGIIRRESGGSPGAQNPSSSAAGCWQMLAMHDWRYYEVGCTPSQKYQAYCNNRAAHHLYSQAGTSPWRL